MPGLELKDLNCQKHAELVQAILAAAPTYLKNVGTFPIQSSSAENLFAALPPSTSLNQKLVLGIYRDELPIGIIDLIRGYPHESTALIGLLLLKESAQGQQSGRASYALLESKMRHWPEIKILRIGVVESNLIALPFWEKMGFEDTGERKPFAEGSVRSQVRVLEKRLSP